MYQEVLERAKLALDASGFRNREVLQTLLQHVRQNFKISKMI